MRPITLEHGHMLHGQQKGLTGNRIKKMRAEVRTSGECPTLRV
jgi:hypothetical protein